MAVIVKILGFDDMTVAIHLAGDTTKYIIKLLATAVIGDRGTYALHAVIIVNGGDMAVTVNTIDHSAITVILSDGIALRTAILI